jgi:succinoglycan biosynthesis protein ExoL
VLDIHRMMLKQGAAGRVLRQIERRLGDSASLVLVSSPGFVRNYFQPNELFEDRLRLVENKIVEVPGHRAPAMDVGTSSLTIGWFGILRCGWSLRTLDELTRADPGRYRVLLRGRPALDQMPDFHAVVEANPYLNYGGPYLYPDDLARIYGAVRLVWMVDRFDAGANSDWLLPNRLYEGGAHGRIPIALEGTEVASFLRSKGIGLVLPRPDAAAAEEILRPLTEESLLCLEAAMRAVPLSAWMTTADDCRSLLNDVVGRAQPSQGHGQIAEGAA